MQLLIKSSPWLFYGILCLTFFSCTSPALADNPCCICTPPNNAKENICLNVEAAESAACAGLPSKYQKLKGYTCKAPAASGNCAPKGAASSVCTEGPIGAKAYVPKDAASDEAPAAGASVKLGIPLPGLTEASSMGQYISAAYSYIAVGSATTAGVGIAIIAAAIMIVYGGFKYILASAAPQFGQGKEIILDALIGMLLVIGSTAILRTINPNTVEIGPLHINAIGHRGSFLNGADEKARIEEYATIKSNTSLEMPIVDESDQAVNAPSAPSTQPSKVGKSAFNEQGNLVAQMDCPQDMKAIRHSDTYTYLQPLGSQVTPDNGTLIKEDVKSFCMDTFEAPDQLGVKPYVGVADWEADWWCQEHGKRLCTSSEWNRACLGPKGANTYGTGPTFEPGDFWFTVHPNQTSRFKSAGKKGKCNVDTPNKSHIFDDKIVSSFNFFFGASKKLSEFPLKDRSTLNMNPKILNDPTVIVNGLPVKNALDKLQAELDRWSGSEPSGSRPGCMTEEGVFDLVGNVQEIMLTNSAATESTDQHIAHGTAAGGKPYVWGNFYWNPVAHNFDPTTAPYCQHRWGQPHVVNWRGWENGFRCCLDLAN